MNIDFLKALLMSRKFWLALIGMIAAVVMFARGGIDADALVQAIVTLLGMVIGGIALEDAAAKVGVFTQWSAETEPAEVESLLD